MGESDQICQEEYVNIQTSEGLCTNDGAHLE
jgi:hypothetical protein